MSERQIEFYKNLSLIRKAGISTDEITKLFERLYDNIEALSLLGTKGSFYPGSFFKDAVIKDSDITKVEKGDVLRITSLLKNDRHLYNIVDKRISVTEFLGAPVGRKISVFFDAVGDLDARFAIEWFDSSGQKIRVSFVQKSIAVYDLVIPPNAVSIQLSIRVQGYGNVDINGIYFDSAEKIKNLENEKSISLAN